MKINIASYRRILSVSMPWSHRLRMRCVAIPQMPNRNSRQRNRNSNDPIDPKVRRNTPASPHGVLSRIVEKTHPKHRLHCNSAGQHRYHSGGWYARTLTKVPGKKTIPSTLIVFIAELSCCIERAIWAAMLLSRSVLRWNACTIVRFTGYLL